MPELNRIRGSETEEQRQYEADFHGDPNSSTEDLDSNMSKMAVGEKDGPLKTFYKKVIKPAFPEAITDLKILGGMTALETRVKHEISNAQIYPEVNRVAEVRRGLELCEEEQSFLDRRRLRTRDSFARYLGLQPEDVDPQDVPIVAFGGSGGGFRAMIGCLAYAEEMEKSGLWDCLTYVAGVSGSCK